MLDYNSLYHIILRSMTLGLHNISLYNITLYYIMLLDCDIFITHVYYIIYYIILCNSLYY